MFFSIEFIPSGNVTDSQEKCIIAQYAIFITFLLLPFLYYFYINLLLMMMNAIKKSL